MPMIWYDGKVKVVCTQYIVLQWDLGEFDQKGTVATRWGTKEELIRACSVAREHGVGVLIDAVLNVRALRRFILMSYLTHARVAQNWRRQDGNIYCSSCRPSESAARHR